MRTFHKSNNLFRQVRKLIPLASQTFSKSYVNFVKGVAPLFLTHGKGSYVWDVDGNRYVDLVNGLLPVILGYQYPAVNRAIRTQMNKAMTLSLAAPQEYELAKLLNKHIPSAEMVRYGKNGSDVTTGAIRLARAVTGREHVLVCGYHGWHDWYIGSTTRNLGVPKSTIALTHKFEYNNLASVEKFFRRYKNKIAAVILEPMSYEEPKDNFLQKLKTLTHKHGALLIFDEVICGFRFSMGGAQKLFGVTPDLATFGKSLGNGMPIAALVGKRKYMKLMEDVFFSFTFGGELLSIAAAIATIKEMEKKSVLKEVWRKGKFLQDATHRLIAKHGLGEVLALKGKPCWQVFEIKEAGGFTNLEIKSYLQYKALQGGFLWHGQHNMSYSHKDADLKKLLVVYDRTFALLRGHLDHGTLLEHLPGKPIDNIFKIR